MAKNFKFNGVVRDLPYNNFKLLGITRRASDGKLIADGISVMPNLLPNSVLFSINGPNSDNWAYYQGFTLEQGKTYTFSGNTNGTWGEHTPGGRVNGVGAMLISPDLVFIKWVGLADVYTFIWDLPTGYYQFRINSYEANKTFNFWNIKIEEGGTATTYLRNVNDNYRCDALKFNGVTQQIPNAPLLYNITARGEGNFTASKSSAKEGENIVFSCLNQGVFIGRYASYEIVVNSSVVYNGVFLDYFPEYSMQMPAYNIIVDLILYYQ